MLPGYRFAVVSKFLTLPLECQFLFKGIGYSEVASIDQEIDDQRIVGCGMPVAAHIESNGAASVVEISGVNGIQVSLIGSAQRLSDKKSKLLFDVAPKRVRDLSRTKVSGTESQSTAHGQIDSRFGDHIDDPA